jgi:membrane protein DedA with SNARE-associated domain
MNLTAILGIFVVSFFLGENAILPAFILANQGYIGLPIVIVSAYLASLAADLFWYVISRFFFKKFDLEQWYNKTKISNYRIYKFILDKHTFLSAFFIKLLVGLRLFLTIALVRIKKFSFGQFLVFSALSNVVLIFSLYILGLFASYSLSFLPAYHRVSGVIGVVAVSLFLLNIAPFVLRSYLTHKKNKSA